jgi:eukaryotic-like serine/threonine-protein kinase
MPDTNPFGTRPRSIPSVVVGAEADPFIGMTIGDFRIDGFIAQGGMGRVYTASNKTVGNLRQAVKVLHDPTQEIERERFLKEAQAASKARSGNIVSISNFGFLPQGQPYLVMELLEGRTLEAYLEQRHRLPFLEALTLTQQVLAALRVIHDEAKMVHRDLKPANLFLVNDRSQGVVVKVMDLGMAAARPRVHAETGVGEHLEVDRGGTPAYASPEQFGNYAVGTASDIYSLGVVLYEMVTGQLPFPEVPGESDSVLARRHVQERPRDPQLLTAGLPEEVSSLIMSMLDKDPTARPLVGAAYNTVVRLRERYKDRQAEGPTHVGLAPGPPSPERAHLPTDRLPALEHRLTQESLARAGLGGRKGKQWAWGLLVLVLLFLLGALGALQWMDRKNLGVTAGIAAPPVTPAATPVVEPPSPAAAETLPAEAPTQTQTPTPGPLSAPLPPKTAPPRVPIATKPIAVKVAPTERKTRVVVEEAPGACTFDDLYRDWARARSQELRVLASKNLIDPNSATYAAVDDELSTAIGEKDCHRANRALGVLLRLAGGSDE